MQEAPATLILVTGANGNLGRRLLTELSARGSAARAVVRSERAAARIAALDLDPAPEVVTLDYLDRAAMADAMKDCRSVVHLVGIIKEAAAGTYEDAHEGTSGIVAQLATELDVERVIYLSIVGTSTNATNPCLASKAQAEQLLLDSPVPALVLRVPMVLGEDDYASAALRGRAHRATNVLLRGESLEQPIYAGDVVAAILAALAITPPPNERLDLAGPRSLPRSELTRMAAAACGGRTRIVSLPIRLGMLMAWLLEKISPNPPVTRAMLGVLDHDDDVDSAGALARLNIELTSLEVMLERCVASPSS